MYLFYVMYDKRKERERCQLVTKGMFYDKRRGGEERRRGEEEKRRGEESVIEVVICHRKQKEQDARSLARC